MNHRGFTLIELSIVLVIIGLIVGGVLVGRDLIEAASVRAQVSQIEKFETAVNTFLVKYNGLPGDIAAPQAAAIGFASRTGAKGHGDGNGIIDFCDGISGDSDSYFGCEDALFWNDLSYANLIEGNFSKDVDSPGTSQTLIFPATQASQYFPTAKLGNNSIVIYSFYGAPSSPLVPTPCNQATIFCYAIMGGGLYTTASGYDNNGTGGITPLEAFAIDTKLDDGIATTGRVQGTGLYLEFGSIAHPNVGSNLGATCVIPSGDGVTYIYNTGSSYATQPVCIMNIAHK